ncbi:kinesin [Trypanosoma grayi]|uniref:kinesin n=1 Tax=Trypanosoma grayi TaxID=71804 RepID=UPI0004F3F2FE|nr:kinesin [Trypanosoma grayi]KEG13525.1 kinesin [Trypanosoma grayi]
MLQESKRVTVGVRIRPKLDGAVNALQAAERYEQVACSQYSDTTLRLWDGRASRDSRTFSFTYDGVFDENTSQEEIYEELAMAAVDNVLSGTNAAILTYGQTGSGKTYTVLGSVRKDPVSDDIITTDTGILLRALQEILHYASLQSSNRHLVVCISAVEIYLDEVRDLLRSEQSPAAIQMVVMKDVLRFPQLTHVRIQSLDDGLKVFQKATARRAQRMTSANDTSSRSHAVFTIEVFQRPIASATAQPMNLAECLALKEAAEIAQLEGRLPRLRPPAPFNGASNALLGTAEAPVMYSKLSLADLAGSEKARNSDVRGEGFEELKKINASLTALGNVVHCLYEGSRHTPYRDSKLTTVLRDSFAAPNARIVLIVNVSPTVLTVDETLSSLYFADKVKMMKPAPGGGGYNVAGNDLAGDYLSALRKYDELIADLRIASVLHKFSGPQIIRLVADDKSNVLYDLNFRVRRPDCEIRRMAASMMCEAFRASAEENRHGASQDQREMEKERRICCDELVTNWKNKRDECVALIESISAQTKVQNDTSEQQTQIKLLEKASAHLGDARAARRGVQQQHTRTTASLSEAVSTLRAVTRELETVENTLEYDSAAPAEPTSASKLWKQQDELWEHLSAHASRAAEAAHMRLGLCTLMRDTQRLASELEQHKKRKQKLQQPKTIYEWLRQAVWGMAGNAVGASLRKESRRRRQELEVVAGHPGFNDYGMRRPRQYWQRKGSESSSDKKRRGTRFDEAALLEDVLSFVRMGGEVTKFSRDGSGHRRLLYVTRKADDERLCWSSVGALGREGYAPLRSVTHILLGRGKNVGERTEYYLSWALVFPHSNVKKTLEFVCDSVGELEAWVIGLSHLTGVKPIFGEPMESLTEEQATWETLSSGEATFCREWHVPPAVYAEARKQIMTRRNERRHSGLRLSPGELRNLVKLDIFRSSAMWLRFAAEGLVSNPTRKLYCYVDAPAIQDASSTATLHSMTPETNDGCSVSSVHA